jgi:hypothetical protein
MDVKKQQGGKTVTPVVRDQYFQTNAAKYPKLNTTFKPEVNNEVKQSMQDLRPEPVKQPPVKIYKPEQPISNPKQTPTPRNDNFNNINKAQEYHRNTWEQVQPTVRPQQPRQQYQQPAPRPQMQQQQPMKQQAPAPRQSSPGRK